MGGLWGSPLASRVHLHVEVVKPERSCLVPRLRQALPKNLGTRLGENYPGSWFQYGLTLFILVKWLHVQEGIFGWNHAMNIFFFRTQSRDQGEEILLDPKEAWLMSVP